MDRVPGSLKKVFCLGLAAGAVLASSFMLNWTAASEIEAVVADSTLDSIAAVPELLSSNLSFYQQSGGEPYMQLEKISTDSGYGYSPDNPIEIGGGFPGGDMEIFRYLNALLDPNGGPISFAREGTCCAFQHNPGRLGTGQGVLDVYLIYHDGFDEPVRLYFNTLEFEQPVAPLGLLYQ